MKSGAAANSAEAIKALKKLYNKINPVDQEYVSRPYSRLYHSLLLYPQEVWAESSLMNELNNSILPPQDAVTEAYQVFNELLCDAAMQGNLSKVQMLLDKGFDPNLPNDFGQTPLEIAALNNHREIAQALLNKGAKIINATQIAQDLGHLNILNDCNVAALDRIYRQFQKVHPEESRIAAESYKNLRKIMQDNKALNGHTCAHLLVSAADEELMIENIFKLPKNYFSNLINDAKSKFEGTSHINQKAISTEQFIQAAKIGDIFTLSLYVAQRGDVNARQDITGTGIYGSPFVMKGATALHHAAFQNQHQAIRFLLYHGMPVNQPTQDGDTSLHIAAMRGNLSSADVLLNNGADTSLTNNHRNTAREVSINSDVSLRIVMQDDLYKKPLAKASSTSKPGRITPGLVRYQDSERQEQTKPIAKPSTSPHSTPSRRK